MEPVYDEELERYLRQFEPRRVGELRLPRPREERSLWLVLGTAAVVLLAIGMAFWHGLRHEPATDTRDSPHISSADLIRSQPRPSTTALTRLAIEEQTAFNTVMTSESQAMFPSMQEERSALRVLAKP